MATNDEKKSPLSETSGKIKKSEQIKEAVQKLIIPAKAISKEDGKIKILKEELEGLTPLFVFVNNKSGGQQGKEVADELKKILNPDQVFDLIADKGPQKGIELFQGVNNARVLVCGGDGTVGWYLNVIDSMDEKQQPPVAVLPLGTGNDLARALGWGGGYGGENLEKILYKVANSFPAQLDRWEIEIGSEKMILENENESENKNKEVEPKKIMNNYLSFGLDARIAMKFHEEREAHPEKFDSRIGNKFQYFLIGNKALFEKAPKLKEIIKLTCDVIEDGREIRKDIELPTNCESLVFLNIPSFMGGSNPWGQPKKNWRPQSMSDQLFEILSVSGTTELAMIKTGLQHGKRLAQARSAIITLKQELEVQMDGEPWKQEPTTIRVVHSEIENVLRWE